MQAGFVFDVNKCVGCQACQIACTIENDLPTSVSWRQVLTYHSPEPDSVPGFHLSLACNHCERAVCLEQCPARAISKSAATGVVEIDPKKCIGCKFCSWVCPYDAPKFDDSNGIMSKCTLCSPRLREGLEPACATICPTDALRFEYLEPPEVLPDIPGFPPSHIKPAIRIEPIRSLPTVSKNDILPHPHQPLTRLSDAAESVNSKISLKKEWGLMVFTLLAAILGGLLNAAVLAGYGVNPVLFAAGGLLGMGLSSFHLGRKFRAYRAILNWRTSWLSREIIGFNLFMATAVIFLMEKESRPIGFLAVGLSLLTALSMDMVYRVTASGTAKRLHSALFLNTFQKLS